MSAERVRTSRLDLLAATVALIDSELRGRVFLSAALDAEVPAGWPPGLYDRAAAEFFRARLLEGGDAAAGWYGWYAITHRTATAPARLVASGGYFGPPSKDGVVEIGYSTVDEERGKGFASELVAALSARALATRGVVTVVAEAHRDNAGSNKVLARCGFRELGAGREPGHRRWVR
jgi:RimJ/RimL family protein N-acetyltransferase